jgi:fido (protein-threonine AMPylation protein)
VPIPWDDDPPLSLARIASNTNAVAYLIDGQARARVGPSLALAFDWHRRIYDNVPLPVPYYAGEVRNSDPTYPELFGYNVEVGGLPGVSHTDVPAALVAFEQSIVTATTTLDAAIAPGSIPASAAALAAVIRLVAYVHGEWVRIHPFANGNGRTARCWANFVALRYGLPAFVTIKPRPASLLYARAANASMTGDHRPTEGLFAAMLRASPVGPGD